MNFAIKGNIIYTKTPQELTIIENGIIVFNKEKILGVFKKLPRKYHELKITDYGNKLIIPGFTDLHVHASQYKFRGIGTSLLLSDWLKSYTFPEEAKFENPSYFKKVYSKFVFDLTKSATTRASIFATIHVDATIELMDLLEASGLITYVGKVNMNMNAPSYLDEKTTENALNNTTRWLEKTLGKYKNTKPIITPRFIPSCDKKLLDGLGELALKNKLPIQSHLSETPSEVAYVKKIEPEATSYGDAYYRHNLFGGKNKTIMAHCVYSSNDEIDLIKKQGVYIAHCPTANTNLSSGIAPIRNYLNKGLKIGLGTDIAAGHSLSIFRAIADAIQVSKLRWRLQDSSLEALTVAEAFYLATKGGGSFFGQVGSFEENYEMDALIIDDSKLTTMDNYSIEDRLERAIYLDSEINIVAKYVKGRQLF